MTLPGIVNLCCKSSLDMAKSPPTGSLLSEKGGWAKPQLSLYCISLLKQTSKDKDGVRQRSHTRACLQTCFCLTLHNGFLKYRAPFKNEKMAIKIPVSESSGNTQGLPTWGQQLWLAVMSWGVGILCEQCTPGWRSLPPTPAYCNHTLKLSTLRTDRAVVLTAASWEPRAEPGKY